jgi:O-antigen ligase
MSMTTSDGNIARVHMTGGLRVALVGSLVGIVASIVLLGHITETIPHFYAVMFVCIVTYILARGEGLFDTLLDYLTSRRMLWRWAFTIWAVLSLLWTTRGRVSVDRAMTIVEIQVLGLILYDAVRRLGLAKVVTGTVFVSAVIAAAQAFLTTEAATVSRLAGLYASPNALGIVGVVGLACFGAGLGLESRRVARVLSYVGTLILFSGIIASVSLKSMASSVFVCVVSSLYRETRARIGVLVMLVVLLGATLIFALPTVRWFWEHSLYRVHTSTSSMSSAFVVSQSTSERTRFVQEGISLIAESPIVGRGLDTFRWLSGEGTYSHNNFVEVGVALGLIGVFLYYGFHVALLRSALGRRVRGTFAGRFTFILVSTLTLLDLGLVSYTFKIPALLMIVCAGMMDRAYDLQAVPSTPTTKGTT